MTEPIWVAPTFVASLNERLVLRSGEPYLLRDYGLLDSAVMVPRNRWHCERVNDPGILGLALAVAIGGADPFEQGNKRTAWAAMLAFFALNGLALENHDHPYYAEVFIDVVTGAQPMEHLIDQMRLTIYD